MALLILAVTSADRSAWAHSPVDFLEVFTAAPSIEIKHSVDLKGRFDQQRVATMLEGPVLFSRAVGCLDRPVKKNRACLSWFRIQDADAAAEKQLNVLDMVRGFENKSLTVSSPEYFLSPAQVITTGAPDPVPDGLDQYIAYRVVDSPTVQLDVQLTESPGDGSRTLGRPLFVCIAVEEWHHDEYFPASHPNDCFVVYELTPRENDEKIGTIDQFGLNQLRTSRSQWLCVRAALLKSDAAENK